MELFKKITIAPFLGAFFIPLQTKKIPLTLRDFSYLNSTYLPTHCGHGSFGSGHGQTTFGSGKGCSS